MHARCGALLAAVLLVACDGGQSDRGGSGTADGRRASVPPASPPVRAAQNPGDPRRGVFTDREAGFKVPAGWSVESKAPSPLHGGRILIRRGTEAAMHVVPSDLVPRGVRPQLEGAVRGIVEAGAKGYSAKGRRGVIVGGMEGREPSALVAVRMDPQASSDSRSRRTGGGSTA